MGLHYCIFKNTNSLDLNMMIAQCPPKSSPLLRYDSITVAGRQGTLTTTDGTYNTYIRQVEFTVFSFDNIDEICALYKGVGWVTFDDEPDKKYIARVSNQIDFTQLAPYTNSFVIQFEVQPFGYELNPQTIYLTSSGSIYNQGTFESQPTITVYGTGNNNITVNGKTFTVFNIVDSVTIDSENYIAYKESTLYITSGEFPVFSTGKNTISFTDANKLVIQPNWRWL